MRKVVLSFIFLTAIGQISFAQLLSAPVDTFTRADTLRGMLSGLRTCYDVIFYDLDIKIDPDKEFIEGSNTIHFLATTDFRKLQVDLFENMDIQYILFEKDTLDFTREGNAVFINFNKEMIAGEINQFKIAYSGKPIVAEKPPWDGGFIWSMDEDSNHWVGVACEGIGASLWWPNKDHLSDKPDSMMIRITVPDNLMNVSNGRLVNTLDLRNGWKRYDWFVSAPINNYNVTVNIGNYKHFRDYYFNGPDSLTLDYYVMPYNYEKAVEHFKQVQPMMSCFEHYLGPYPFYGDGYKLVETPYLGMEHQSAIAYGNKYKTGYAGMDFSRIGLDFDYIIIHETGHEWWGNSVSCRDIADLWIHEGFCTYSEALYVECLFGYDTAMAYVNAKKTRVGNAESIIGRYNVNNEGSGDMYHKGMLILNTIRHIVDNDALWFDIISGIADTFKYATVSTATIENYIIKKSGKDLSKIFDQYLRHASIPVLEYNISKVKRQHILSYRWVADVEGFNMPVKATIAGEQPEFIYPATAWQEIELSKRQVVSFSEDNFYFKLKDTQKADIQ